MSALLPGGGGPRSAQGRRLAEVLPPLVARLRGPALDRLAERLHLASRGRLSDEGPSADLLAHVGAGILRARREKETERSAFLRACRMADGAGEVRAVLLQHLRATRTGRDLWLDRRALRRWLDADALAERMDRLVEELGVELELVALLLGSVALSPSSVAFLAALVEDRRLPTRRAAVTTLADQAGGGARRLPPELLRQLIQIARQRRGDPITSRRALPVLLALEPEEREALLLDRLAPPRDEPGSGDRYRDDFLVRAEVARITQGLGGAAARRAFSLARSDPSETVRVALAEGMAAAADREARGRLQRLAAEDPSRCVRLNAAMLLGGHRLGEERGPTSPGGARPGRVDAPSLAMMAVVQELGRLEDGERAAVTLPQGEDVFGLARLLVPLVEDGHGFGLELLSGGRVRVSRGERRTIRLWRVLHETTRPSPMKRPLGDHLTGRSVQGDVRVPPRRLAEMSPTGVPGQRVYSPAWGSWAPWLPSPEDYLDSLWRGPIHLVTAEGLTTVEPPHGAWDRARAFSALTVGMASISRSRQESLEAGDEEGRGRYVARLSALGFQVTFDPRGPTRDEIRHCFGLPPSRDPGHFVGTGGVAMGLGGGAVGQSIEAFAGVRHNLPVELALVCLLFGALFVGRLGWLINRTRRARRSLPLVIGGWGTRGKSGTERLKAAVFEGLGYPVLCKTTGTEAVVLHTPPGGRATELMVYRPYERATIWEHADVLHLASSLKAPVFLWECMALRTEYVEQLQLHWTRDDISTITNAYPDHEDVQGPAGQDVARSISAFIPRGGLLVTSEVQMLPVLRDKAGQRGAAVEAVPAHDVERLPRDLLARIPYMEHPANVALVAATARALGLDGEEALVLAGDHVVPDLGSLVTWPAMRLGGRVIEFTNGMSANDRTGFLNNWERAGFSQVADEATFNVTVVNNRRDRVARSQVFARILVNDASPAHRHVLVGGNLQGFMSYLQEELDRRVDALDLFSGGRGALAGRLERFERGLGVVSPGEILKKTGARLGLSQKGTAQMAKLMEKAVAAAPARPVSIARARRWLSALEAPLARLASTASASWRPGGGHDSPFHDAPDRERGLSDAVEHWLSATALAVACQALARAATEATKPSVVPSRSAPERPAPAMGDMFASSAAEAAFWDDEQVTEVTVEEELPTPRLAALNEAARRLYREVFLSRVVMIEGEAPSGDRLLDALSRAAPPGATVRAMGVQNIKGAGLDLVYRWVHAREVLGYARDLSAPEEGTRRAALARIERFREWSVPACGEVLRLLASAPPDPAVAGQVAAARATVEDALEERRRALERPARLGEPGRFQRWLRLFWDPFDAILRRQRADAIWRDLAAGRISHPRAARELARLSQRQRGELASQQDPALVP